MMKLKYVSITVILTMMLGLLAACGGDNATATPIPPTATVPPPTAVPTDTAVPAPTNTTTAMVGTTPAATIGTTGGMMATPGGGMMATSGDVALIQQAVTATQELKSYHFTMQVSGEVFTQPVQLEGDYVAPDKLYVKGTAEGKAIEEVVSGGKAYEKGTDGKWTEVQPSPTPAAGAAGGLGGDVGSMMGGLVPGTDPSQLAQDPNVIKSLAPLLGSVGGFSDTQQNETLDGVSTRHFTFKMDAESMMREQGGTDQLPPNMQNVSFGGGGFWIDPNTKYLHKLDLSLDIGGLMKFLFDAMSAAFGGTATPGGEQATPTPAVNININVVITKHNDPSITIPTVP